VAVIGGINFPNVSVPEEKQQSPSADGSVLDRLYDNAFDQEQVTPPAEQPNPLDSLYANIYGDTEQGVMPPQSIGDTLPQDFWESTIASAADSPFVQGLLEKADSVVDWTNTNLIQPVWSKIGEPVNKALDALRQTYLKTAHPVLANIYAERFPLEDKLKADLDTEKKMKQELANLKSLPATVANRQYYDSRKAEYERLREQNASGQWGRLKKGFTEPLDPWVNVYTKEAVQNNASFNQVISAFARDVWANLAVTPDEIK